MNKVKKLNNSEKVAARNTTEEKTQPSAIDFGNLFEHIPEKVFIKDRRLVYIFCNKNYADSLEMVPEEIIGKTDFDLFPKELADKYRADDKRIIETGKEEEIEEKYTGKGQERWAYTVKSPCTDETGKIIGVLGIFRDITERRKAQEELRLSKERAELIYKTVPCAIFTVDKEKRITTWNKKAAELTGYTAKEALGRKCHFFTLKPCTEKCGLYSEDVVKPIVGRECVIKRKDGKEPVILKNADYLKDANGNVIGGIESFEDITARKNIEKKLLESNEQFIKIFELSPDGIVISAWEDGKIIAINNAALSLLGFTREEVIGHTSIELNIWRSPHDRNTFVKSLIKKRTVKNAEIVFRKKTGEVFYVNISASFIELGRKKSLILVIRDIDAHKKLEIALKKSYLYLAGQKKLLEKKNIAFQEAIKEIDIEKNALKDDIILNINEIIMPILKKLKLRRGDPYKYLDLLEKSLRELTSPFGRRLIETVLKLTPKEIEVCNMIKFGLTTKEMSGLLNSSSQTIDKHRKNIRKKLGLSRKGTNLTSFLQSL